MIGLAIRPSIRKAGRDPSFFHYSSYSTEWNWKRLSQNIYYMFPLCNSYFRFWSKSVRMSISTCYQECGRYQICEHRSVFLFYYTDFSCCFYRLGMHGLWWIMRQCCFINKRIRLMKKCILMLLSPLVILGQPANLMVAHPNQSP